MSFGYFPSLNAPVMEVKAKAFAPFFIALLGTQALACIVLQYTGLDIDQ